MPVKVKRGLGLVAVALIALLAVVVIPSGDLDPARDALWDAAFLAGVVGLVLVAWGLLRD